MKVISCICVEIIAIMSQIAQMWLCISISEYLTLLRRLWCPTCDKYCCFVWLFYWQLWIGWCYSNLFYLGQLIRICATNIPFTCFIVYCARSLIVFYKYITYVILNFGHNMMTSSNGNIFRVTGHLCGEFTGHRWIPHTKASDAELWCFLGFAHE